MFIEKNSFKLNTFQKRPLPQTPSPQKKKNWYSTCPRYVLFFFTEKALTDQQYVVFTLHYATHKVTSLLCLHNVMLHIKLCIRYVLCYTGQDSLESTSLLCLQLIETSLEKAGTFLDACRETGASAMVSAMDRLLLSINPRSGKADHLVNITK